MSRKDDIQKLITNLNRRLQALKERKALYGSDTPIAVLTEIEDIEAEIEELRSELKNLASDTEQVSLAVEATSSSTDHTILGKTKTFAPLWLWGSVAAFVLMLIGSVIAFFSAVDNEGISGIILGVPTPTPTETFTPTPTETYIPPSPSVTYPWPSPSVTYPPEPSDTPIPTPTFTPTPTRYPGESIEVAGITFVFVPQGEFIIGYTNGESDEIPEHRVHVRSFWIMRTELTNEQYRNFIDSGGYDNEKYWSKTGWNWRTSGIVNEPLCWGNGEVNGDQQPVVCISWYEANAYAKWFSEQTNIAMRLPTEVEWENGYRTLLIGLM